jgi:hypothetical protein
MAMNCVGYWLYCDCHEYLTVTNICVTNICSVDAKALEQVYEYGAFLQEKYAGGKTSFSKVVCFVVGGQKSSNPIFRKKEKKKKLTPRQVRSLLKLTESCWSNQKNTIKSLSRHMIALIINNNSNNWRQC